MKPSSIFLEMDEEITSLQKKIATVVEEVDGNGFKSSSWKHANGGGGNSLTLSQGNVFEKAGLNVSNIESVLSDEIAEMLQTQPGFFRACGISLVFHPRSPMIPTIHMNLRYFETESDSWFGGGVDLTPYYPFEEDFVHFHRTLQVAVTQAYPDRYEEFKKRCDDYFYLPHRKEMRGVGGIFFDYLKNRGMKENHQKNFDLVKKISECFCHSYFPLVRKRQEDAYGEEEVLFQKFRRGRYVEFNLLYDRGTQFGLKTGGRINSILVSLPPEVSFPIEGEGEPEEGSLSKTMKAYYQPRSWL